MIGVMAGSSAQSDSPRDQMLTDEAYCPGGFRRDGLLPDSAGFALASGD